jgi:TM2 domain-containing membrane protein YozV
MGNTGQNPFFDDAEFSMLSRMSDAQRTDYASRRKDSVIALLLCLFLGGFGAHRFYLKQSGLGILYVLSVWTLIPVIISLLELFVVGDRTRAYNLNIAREILNCGEAGVGADRLAVCGLRAG